MRKLLITLIVSLFLVACAHDVKPNPINTDTLSNFVQASNGTFHNCKSDFFSATCNANEGDLWLLRPDSRKSLDPWVLVFSVKHSDTVIWPLVCRYMYLDNNTDNRITMQTQVKNSSAIYSEQRPIVPQNSFGTIMYKQTETVPGLDDTNTDISIEVKLYPESSNLKNALFITCKQDIPYPNGGIKNG